MNGLLTLEADQVQPYKKRESREFIRHIKATLRYLEQRVYRRLTLIMDNATSHKSKATALFPQAHKAEVKPFLLPRCALKLNEADTRIKMILKRNMRSNYTYSISTRSQNILTLMGPITYLMGLK